MLGYVGVHAAFASLPARGVWVEIDSLKVTSFAVSSLPARGVWVEISMYW